jgi:hypothetical protein
MHLRKGYSPTLVEETFSKEDIEYCTCPARTGPRTPTTSPERLLGTVFSHIFYSDVFERFGSVHAKPFNMRCQYMTGSPCTFSSHMLYFSLVESCGKEGVGLPL